jgi:hypothetical protein
LKISAARVRFSLALAVIAAAIADPLVECASNAGWFGPGSFTDRSNLDVLPSLIAGSAFLAILMFRKASAILAGEVIPRHFAALIPSIFAMQIGVLYVMETAEQLLTAGHVAGPTTWLGGPLPVSLAVHAAVCAGVTFAIARSHRVLAATALRVIRLVRAIAVFAAQAAAPVARRFEHLSFSEPLRVLCALGERAPPIALA